MMAVEFLPTIGFCVLAGAYVYWPALTGIGDVATVRTNTSYIKILLTGVRLRRTVPVPCK